MGNHRILKTTAILLTSIISISISFVWSAEPDHFRKYSYPADGFEVAFPQKPLKFLTEHKGLNGGYSNSYQAIVANPFSQYSVFVGHSSKRVFEDAAIEAYFDGIVRGLVSGSDEAVLVYKKNINFLNFPAMEYQYTCKVEGVPVVVRGIVLMVDGEHTRLSQISIPNNPNSGEEFKRFVGSFRLLPIDVALSNRRFDDHSRGISFFPPAGWQQDKPEFVQMVAIFFNPGGHSITVLDSGTPAYVCDNYKHEMQGTQIVQATGDLSVRGRTMMWLKSTAHNAAAGIRMTSIHYCLNTTKGAVVMIGAAPEQTFFRSETAFRNAAMSLSVRK